MAVKKEFSCPDGHDFEGLIAVCPVCGKVGRRVFRTAPQISKGGAFKKDEAFLAAEFSRRGITNYSNKGGMPRASFNGVESRMLGEGVYQSGEIMAGVADPSAWQRSAIIARTNEALGQTAPIAIPAFARGKSEGAERVARGSGIPTERIRDSRENTQ